jgi:DNA repair protein RadD
MTVLRAYQVQVIDDVRRAVETGRRRVLAVAPTGSGKTLVASEIIQAAVDNGERVLVLAHTREIIRQTSIKLYGYNIEHGIIQAGLVANPERPAQVASIQTLWTRAMRLERMPLPPADVLIVDEAHHCPAETYRKIVGEYPAAVLLGLTATPCRGDGRGLGDIFDIIVECPQVADLIAQGHLVRTRVYAPIDPDLRGVETRQGDYVESQLAGRMDRDNLVGDIISHWHRYGERRRTVCFAVNVAHSIHIRNEFIKSGVRAEHVDGGTPKPERDAALARLASGETELITNCMVLTEGWDMPEVSCGILARPTRKMGLYRQMIGRILRRRRANATRSSSTRAGRCSGTASSRTTSIGRSTRSGVPQVRRTPHASPPDITHASWNVHSAVRSAPQGRPVSTAASFHSVRRRRSCSPMALSALSTARAFCPRWNGTPVGQVT